MSRTMRWAFAAIATALPWLVTETVSAQGQETMWTEVTARGGAVYLRWHRRHPWAGELPSAAQLVANYATNGGRAVAEVIGTPEDAGEERLRRFQLPQTLRDFPAGPVCLTLRLRDGRLVPVRAPSGDGADTVGFRYAAWEEPIVRETRVQVAQRRLADAEIALAVGARNLEQQRAVAASRGWQDFAGCDAIAPSARGGVVKPYDVVEPARHDAVARQVCVRRIWNARLYAFSDADKLEREGKTLGEAEKRSRRNAASVMFSETFGLAAWVPESLGVLAELPPALAADPVVQARRAQAAEFLEDWRRLVDDIASYRPHLGREGEPLAWASEAAEVAEAALGRWLLDKIGGEWIKSPPAATREQQLAFIGVSMDTYFGCLEDSVKQLAIKAEAWRREVESAPAREAAAREFLVRECRAGVELLRKVEAEHAALVEQLDREQANFAAVAESADAELPAGDRREQVLNFSTCGPR